MWFRGGAISTDWGIVIGAFSVLIYTVFGGMWSVAITDFVQMIVIVIGLVFIGFVVNGKLPGGVSEVIAHASNAGKFEFFPSDGQVSTWIIFAAAFMTMAFGSTPQQDVFQRVASAKNENIAGASSVLGGCLYFIFAFLPLFIAYAATMIDPGLVNTYLKVEGDSKASQKLLPMFIMNHVPLFAQIMFFGALLSAIKSCASATLLAPSITFSENIIKPFMKNVSDQKLLLIMRIVLVVFTIIISINAMYSKSTIFEMVEQAYKVTLVGAFIPLVCGLYWKRATTLGALLSICLGLSTWLLTEVGASFAPDLAQILKSMGTVGSWLLWVFAEKDGVWSLWFPPQLVGFVFAVLGMLIGSLLPIKGNESKFYLHQMHHKPQ